MPQIIVLPHVELCPEGTVINADSGISVCDALLQHDIDIDHACDKVCACTTCHVIVKQGSDRLSEPEEAELDLLDKAPGLTPTSRLGCQAVIEDDAEIPVVIPRFTINAA